MTELLSVGRHFTRGAVSAAWLAFSIGAGGAAWWSWRGRAPAPSREEPPDVGSRLILGGAALVAALTAGAAVICPPNTWDAMEYHLPRVLRWIDERSVANYPTFDYSQLTLGPWTEYAMAHLHLLAGNDRFVDLVPWAGYALSAVFVSLIAAQLGAGRRGQVLAAVACATLWQGVLGASSAKNDWALALWVVATACFLLRFRNQPSWATSTGIGASVGLAVLTKGSALLFLPGVMLGCAALWPLVVWRRVVARAGFAASLVLMLNSPLWVRNVRLSGSPLGFASPDGETDVEGRRQFANRSFAPSAIAANIIRNAALHLGTPSDVANRWTQGLCERLIKALGRDPNDPGALEIGKSGRFYPFVVPRISRHEIFAGDQLHALLFCAAFLALLFQRRRAAVIYGLGIAAAFVVFCAALRWQPFNARLQLPLFVLAAALFGVAIERLRPRWIFAVGVLMVLAAMPFALTNQLRPLVTMRPFFHAANAPTPYSPVSIFQRPRERLYFADAHDALADSWIEAARLVGETGCRDVGIDVELEHFEYPMMALLGAGTGARTVRYVGVTNRSASTARPGVGEPCAVVCLGCAGAPAKWAAYRKPEGLARVLGDVVIFSNSEMVQPR